MTDVERIPQLANPVTGEALTLASSDDELGRFLEDIREFESVIREHKALVNRELLARLDKRRNWTLHLDDGLKLTAPSDEPGEEWDGAGLYNALHDLADQDIIGTDAVNAAVEIEHTYKVKRAGVKSLRKSPTLAQVVDRFCTPAEKPRYVKVSRA